MIMDLIDRDALQKEIYHAYEYEYPTANGAFDEFVNKILRNIINNAPTVDVVEVRHGKWIVTAGGKECDCPVCGEWFDNTCNYDIRKTWKWCPVCGTKMDGD